KARTALQVAKAGTLIALSVGGALADCEAVQKFWRQHYQAAFAERMEGSKGECMVSGKLGVIAPTHEKIKGVASLGGQASGVALMSFDKEAFRSYGWEQNQNSPVSPDRALAYVLALNHLLKQDNGRRKDIAGIGFLYWLKNPADIDVVENLIERADPQQVEKLLNFDPSIDPDPNRFYMLGVSGNGGRLRVRYWADLALTQVKLNLQNWHRQLRVEYPWDGPLPVRFKQVLSAIWEDKRQKKKSAEAEAQVDRKKSPPEHLVLALLRRGIEGLPLGYSVLSAVLTRLRHPGGDNAGTKEKKGDPMSLQRLRVPMGLVRMCLNDLFRQQKGRNEMSEGLDPTCTIPAYVCGRLMAEFENLQSTTARKAGAGDVNSTITDRFFSLASTYPAAAFSKIVDLGQKHLKKLRRMDRGAAYAIEKKLMEIENLLQPDRNGPYPSNLSLEEQGLFALGYYHQKAWSIAQARDRKQSNETVNNDNDQEN
ncbi:MAG: type I-C CRISPR-associated protein Cas8c/Csd1, partial [Sulfobacillus sp.]